MKKIFFVVLMALFTMSLCAATTLETQSTYVRAEGINGLAYGLNYFTSVYKGTDLVKEVDVGLSTNLAAINGMYNFIAAPTVKVSIPLFYAKAGFGWDYANAGNISDNSWIFTTAAGLNFELTSTVKAGIELSYFYNINNKISMYQIGPMFSFNL